MASFLELQALLLLMRLCLLCSMFDYLRRSPFSAQDNSTNARNTADCRLGDDGPPTASGIWQCWISDIDIGIKFDTIPIKKNL